MAGKRYKALRTFYWQPAGGGDERLARTDDVINGDDLSDQKVADLLVDGLIRETRANTKGDE